jgi:hypothetical protein
LIRALNVAYGETEKRYFGQQRHTVPLDWLCGTGVLALYVARSRHFHHAYGSVGIVVRVLLGSFFRRSQCFWAPK